MIYLAQKLRILPQTALVSERIQAALVEEVATPPCSRRAEPIVYWR